MNTFARSEGGSNKYIFFSLEQAQAYLNVADQTKY